MSTSKYILSIFFVLLFILFSSTGLAQTLDLTESLTDLERHQLNMEALEADPDAEVPEETVEPPPVTIFDMIDRRELSREILFDPDEDRDIFVLPWVVDAVNATRLLVLGEGYIEQKQYDEAIRVLGQLVTQYQGLDQALIGKEKLEQAQGLKRQQDVLQEQLLAEEERAEQPDLATLPSAVYNQISAVIWDNEKSYILYRQDPISTGYSLPDFPQIMIHGFSEPDILFQVDEEILSLEFKPDYF